METAIRQKMKKAVMNQAHAGGGGFSEQHTASWYLTLSACKRQLQDAGG
jgi:hypothetical protein